MQVDVDRLPPMHNQWLSASMKGIRSLASATDDRWRSMHPSSIRPPAADGLACLARRLGSSSPRQSPLTGRQLPGACKFQSMSVETEVVHGATDEVVEAFARLLPQLSAEAKPLDHEAVERLTGASTNTLLVARVEGLIVGTLTLVTSPLPSGLRAHIEDVVVDAAARGHGVGKALIDKALGLAVDAGARTVDLTSRPSRETANRLYERAGFQRRESTVHRVTLDRSGAPASVESEPFCVVCMPSGGNGLRTCGIVATHPTPGGKATPAEFVTGSSGCRAQRPTVAYAATRMRGGTGEAGSWRKAVGAPTRWLQRRRRLSTPMRAARPPGRPRGGWSGGGRPGRFPPSPGCLRRRCGAHGSREGARCHGCTSASAALPVRAVGPPVSDRRSSSRQRFSGPRPGAAVLAEPVARPLVTGRRSPRAGLARPRRYSNRCRWPRLQVILSPRRVSRPSKTQVAWGSCPCAARRRTRSALSRCRVMTASTTPSVESIP